MRRILISALLLFFLCAFAAAEPGLKEVRCEEEGFSTKIPSDAEASYTKNTGLQIFAEKAGYVPYAIVSRRPAEMKLKDPVNYLNNVFREHMENQYGEDSLGMNPCRGWEIGGKTLLGARYYYKVRNTRLCLLRLVEAREDGDVEYTAKFIDGSDEAVMNALDAAVRHYRPYGSGSPGAPEALRPAEIPSGSADTSNGVFWARIKDADRILAGGYFTVGLYAQDLYPADRLEALQPGDAVLVNGRTYTVKSFAQRGDGEYELIPQEEVYGYIAFRKTSGGAYTAVMDDWTPCTHLTDVKIMMPLPYKFSFAWISGDESAKVYDADAFVSLMTDGESAELLTQYNTMIQFEDGLLTMIIHTDYPEGPEAY